MRDKLTAEVHGRKMVYVYQPEMVSYRSPIKRMTMAEARRRGVDDMVLMCATCNSTADYVDHLFPYHQEWNRCKRCDDMPPGGKRGKEEA